MATDAKRSGPVLTADNFAEALQSGAIANIIRGNYRVLQAWNLGGDALPRRQPDQFDISVPYKPAIPPVPAVVANPLLGIFAVAAIPGIPAVPEIASYEHTAAGELEPEARRKLLRDITSHHEQIEKDQLAAGCTMKLFLDSYDEALLRRVKDHDLVLANQYIDANSVWSLAQLTLVALNQSTLNSASAALHSLLNQPGPPRSGDLATLLNHTPMRILCQNATNLLSDAAHPQYVSIDQLATYGFIRSLCAVRDKEFLAWFNTAYPTGICATPLVHMDRYKLFALAKSEDTVTMQNEEVAQLNCKRDERDMLAFFSKAKSTHGVAVLENIAIKALQAHVPRLHGIIKAGTKGPAGPKGEPKGESKDKAGEGKSDGTRLKPKVCSQCGKTFVPIYACALLVIRRLRQFY